MSCSILSLLAGVMFCPICFQSVALWDTSVKAQILYSYVDDALHVV